MTKNEFSFEAGKAGIPPELYGAVLRGQLYSTCGPVSGGKVVGIEWFDEVQTQEEYNYMVGTYNVSVYRKAPYVVLTKNRKKYLVAAWKVTAYIDKAFKKWLAEKIKNKEML